MFAITCKINCHTDTSKSRQRDKFMQGSFSWELNPDLLVTLILSELQEPMGRGTALDLSAIISERVI